MPIHSAACVCVCVCSSDGVARRSTPSGRTDALAALLVRPDDGVKAEALSVLLEVLRRGTAAWDGTTGNDFRRRMMSDGEGFPLAGEITALARKILVWALRMKNTERSALELMMRTESKTVQQSIAELFSSAL